MARTDRSNPKNSWPLGRSHDRHPAALGRNEADREGPGFLALGHAGEFGHHPVLPERLELRDRHQLGIRGLVDDPLAGFRGHLLEILVVVTLDDDEAFVPRRGEIHRLALFLAVPAGRNNERTPSSGMLTTFPPPDGGGSGRSRLRRLRSGPFGGCLTGSCTAGLSSGRPARRRGKPQRVRRARPAAGPDELEGECEDLPAWLVSMSVKIKSEPSNEASNWEVPACPWQVPMAISSSIFPLSWKTAPVELESVRSPGRPRPDRGRWSAWSSPKSSCMSPSNSGRRPTRRGRKSRCRKSLFSFGTFNLPCTAHRFSDEPLPLGRI